MSDAGKRLLAAAREMRETVWQDYRHRHPQGRSGMNPVSYIFWLWAIGGVIVAVYWLVSVWPA
jgi:hypothetical protein